MGSGASYRRWRNSKRSNNQQLKKQTKCPVCSRKFQAWQTYHELNSHLDYCLDNPTQVARPGADSLIRVFDLPFNGKVVWLKEQCDSTRVPWISDHVTIFIDREDLLMNSAVALLNLTEVELHKEFQIEFIGERANDAGGLLREWLNLCVVELFRPDIAVFDKCATGKVAYKFIIKPEYENRELYEFCGKVLGKALFENIPIYCPLSKTIYRKLQGIPITMEDLLELDADLYSSLKFIENEDIEQVLFETFTVTKTVQGVNYAIDLIPNGSNVSLTNDNKSEYIRSRIEFETSGPHIDSFLNGFYSFFSTELLSVFDTDQLELLMCGNPFIDISDWETFTEYTHPLSKDHKLVQWFWAVLKDFSQENTAKLLFFVTGTYRPPILGFSCLATQRGEPALFTIECFKAKMGTLPLSHTCFNRLSLPLCSSIEELERGLIYVIEHCLTGFGLE